MSKHKHYDMIVAKAANMDLVVFVKDDLSGELKWREMVNSFPISVNHEYFLCLPQHKEACLHWLNGGEVQVKYEGENWNVVFSKDNPTWLGENYFMMRDSVDYRIKPRKEKRWIGYCANTNQSIPHPKVTKDLAIDYVAANYNYTDSDWQFIEIEIEV